MIWITGASGLLGANLARLCHGRSENVFSFYRSNPFSITKSDHGSLDFLDPRPLRDLTKSHCPKLIVHAAALTNLSFCEHNPKLAHAVHVQTTENLAKVADECGAKFVYISTDAVYDGKQDWFDESADTNPINVYGQTKLNGENVTLNCSDNGLVVRTNFFGWNFQNKKSLADWVLTELRKGKRIVGFTDVYFTPIYVGFLCEAILNLVEKNASGIYHIAGSEKLSKFDFARKIAELAGVENFKIEPGMSAKSLEVKRSNNMALCTEKVAGFLNQKMPSVEKCLQAFFADEVAGVQREIRKLNSL